MTEMTMLEDRPPHRNGSADEPHLVTATALGEHLDCTRQYIARLTAEGVIEKVGDRYDVDACRLRYLRHLRSENRRSPRAAADAAFTEAKATLLNLRIAEKQKTLMAVADHIAFVDELVGLLNSHLSGFPAQIAGRDLSLRRRIEQGVFDLRTAIADAAKAKADECEPEET